MTMKEAADIAIAFLASVTATLLLFVLLFPALHTEQHDNEAEVRQLVADGDKVCIRGLIRTEYDPEPFQVVVCGDVSRLSDTNEDTHLAVP